MADDKSKNAVTFTCVLPKGHLGLHVEHGTMYRVQPYTITWFDKTEKETDSE